MGKVIIPFIIIFLLVSSSYGSISHQTENVTIEKTSSIPVDGPMDSAWTMQCHDLHHSGCSPYSTAAALVEKWRFPGNGWVYASPVIDNEGTVYFGADGFFAIRPNGTAKWIVDDTFIYVFSAPAIDENGIIYVGLDDFPAYLIAFYPNGTEKWRYSSDYIFSSPVIDTEGIIYFGEYNGDLKALYPNGTLKWSTPNIYSVYSSPAIGDDGTIYCTSWSGGNVYAIYPNNGTVKWQFSTGGQMKANPSIAEDGTIYVSSWSDYLYALYPNGTMKWKVNTKYGCSNNPSIGPDGTIYVAHVDLYAINPDGTVKWIFPLGDERDCSFAAPAISADGTIYIGANIGDGIGGELIVVNPDGTERWRSGSICNEGIVSSPAIAEDGTVYIGSLNDYEVYPGGFDSRGYLHAFGVVESNSSPGTPTITGTVNGTVREEYWYRFTSIDPDNNPVTCSIDWGDGSAIESKDFASGEQGWASHTYTRSGAYTIKAKARDTLGAESDWGTLTVTMPTSYNQPLLKFVELLFQRFPNVFPIIRHLLGFNQ